MQRMLALAGLVLALAAQAGCNARQVLKEPAYGVVSIPQNSNAWPMRYRDKADEVMQKHFPDGYEIVREEEVVVGQQTRVNEDEERADVAIIDGVLSVGATERRTTATTTDVTEYHIHYVPRGEARPPMQLGSAALPGVR